MFQIEWNFNRRSKSYIALQPVNIDFEIQAPHLKWRTTLINFKLVKSS